MKMAVIGGGNIGTLMAAEMASKGHEVTIVSSKPEKWCRTIQVFTAQEEKVFTGTLSHVTSNLEEAVEEAEIIWITMPAQTLPGLGKRLESCVKAGQMLGMVPGSGGAEFAFRGLFDRGCTLFGLQRVHSIARLKEYGRSVYMLGRKSELQIGSIPGSAAAGICSLAEQLFDMPCVTLPNYLCVTLTPSNPILHTARLFSMFRDYGPGVSYDKNFLFYEEWTDDASRMLIACDQELQELCGRIPMELRDVKSLKVHYESPNAEAMTAKIRGIKAFRGLASPMKETADGWVPDFDSRYFTADFSFGLKIIRDMARLFEVETPHIDEVWKWYETVCEDHPCFQLMCGSREEFIRIYQAS